MQKIEQNLESLQINKGQRRVGYCYDEIMLKHSDYPESKHAESPARIQKVYENLQQKGLLSQCIKIESSEITKEDLLLVHSQNHIERIEELATDWSDLMNPKPRAENKPKRTFATDTFDCVHTPLCAKISAGSCLNLLKDLISNNIDTGFAIVRPPGHHATSEQAMGFCFFNNIAILAQYLWQFWIEMYIMEMELKTYSETLKKYFMLVCIDMTKQIFIQQCFIIQGSGNQQEVGGQSAKGFTVNIPWNTDINEQMQRLEQEKKNLNVQKNQEQPTSKIGDVEYKIAFDQIIIPILKQFQPQIILVSAGFDAALGDPKGRLSVTETGFLYMTQELLKVQQVLKLRSKTLFLLEGGYNIDVLVSCTEVLFRYLLGENIQIPQIQGTPIQQAIEDMKFTYQNQKEYWQLSSFTEFLAQ